MAGSVNKVILIGNLGADPEIGHGHVVTVGINADIAGLESLQFDFAGCFIKIF